MIDDFDVRAILGVFRRRYLMILSCVALGLLVAALALFAIRPTYSATALVMVDPSRKDLLDPITQASAGQSDSARVDGEVELVKSDTTILAVVQTLDLVGDAEFGVKLGLKDRIWELLGLGRTELPTGEAALNAVMHAVQSAVAVQRRGATFLIGVTARSERADFAARLANAVATAYIDEQVRSKISAMEASRDIIDARMGDAGAALARAEQAFDQFIDDNLQQISRETGRGDLVALRAEIDAVIAQRDETAGSAGRVEQALSERDWPAITAELRTEAVRELERQRSALVAAASDGSETDTVSLRDELVKLEGELTQIATAHIGDEQVASAAAQERATALRTQLRRELLNSTLPAATLAALYQLQQAAEISRRQYQTLASRQADLETQANLQVADSRIASVATTPSEPSFPSTRMFLLVGLLGGLVAGAGLALVTENFLGGFEESGQLEDALRVPTLAAIPWQKPPGGSEANAADNMVSAPMSPFAEGVRRVRVAVDRTLREHEANEGRVIVVTSSGSGEGKSSLALSLARSYALHGRSTLLVDCDLRRPSLHRYMRLQPSSGLVDYLSGGSGIELESILSLDEPSGAHVIVGARPSDRPTEALINNARFQRLLEAARRSFDYVVLDTPPAGPVVDAFVLGSMADIVLFVVKCETTPQSVVKATMKELQASLPDVPVRTVLSQKREPRAGYRTRYDAQYAG